MGEAEQRSDLKSGVRKMMGEEVRLSIVGENAKEHWENCKKKKKRRKRKSAQVRTITLLSIAAGLCFVLTY